MNLDFQKINRENVGYRTSATHPGGAISLHELTFEDFIPPYAHEALAHLEVYKNLESVLNTNIVHQDSVLDGRRSVMVDVLADATLQREAIREAMSLIKKHYL